jgi:glycosyltransferase involved in cell wall biosynthesis
MPNREVMSLLESEVDLVVDQLLFFGYGMFAIEAMAMGLPVIANLEDSEFAELLSDYTFFGECPVMSAKASTIEDVLRSIIRDRSILSDVGKRSAEYVQKWHSPNAARLLFSNIINAIRGDSTGLKTLYHPKANLIPTHYQK